MRRVFALLLLTPLLANCTDSAMPVAPAGAMHTEGTVGTEGEWPVEENWLTPEGAFELVQDEMSMSMSTQDVGTAAAPAPGAVMTLGNADTGSPFPNSHDGSWHANDRMNPGTVVMNAGETVTFNIVFGHRLAIYADGVQPKDIPFQPGPLLLYAPGRIFLQQAPTPTIKLKFLKPGKYLVVCAIAKHFYEANQWGWLIVK